MVTQHLNSTFSSQTLFKEKFFSMNRECTVTEIYFQCRNSSRCILKVLAVKLKPTKTAHEEQRTLRSAESCF